MDRRFDIVVVGGGHAGAEAARAAGRLGANTALVTLSPGAIARMSCNPAVGGVGKGQIVREIDAMGGLMGLAADATGIQFRMLNRSKGPAVWGPRCQSDRHAYAGWVRQALARQEHLEIIAGEAVDILTDRGRVVALRVALGEGGDEKRESTIGCDAVVVTAGTFLNGLMHLGEKTWSGGRYGEPPAAALSDALKRCGLRLGRLKTGTCPRLAAESIDYDRCTRQDGDERPAPFSFLNDSVRVRQEPCWITATTPEVHRIIRANLHRAPLFTGRIRATGPRYCPSIETKIDHFPDKAAHQVFLEPEGRDTNWIYCNGISTSLPPDVQDAVVRGIAGLGRAEILRYGYAIEYDYVPPTQLTPTLRAKTTAGLFLAGQINGTTGYEEAAAQGLIAGLNAAISVAGGADGLVLRRDQAYIGVMIDDLVTKGLTEPYRMFTSRAEHRLRLRADNADRRLTEIGRRAGLVDDRRWERYLRRRRVVEAASALCGKVRVEGRSIAELFRRQTTTWDKVLAELAPDAAAELEDLKRLDPGALESLAVDLRYAGYLAREDKALGRLRELDARKIPEQIDYSTVAHLRAEARERLQAVAPRSLGQALRVSGITPADVTVLAVHLAGRGACGQAREG